MAEVGIHITAEQPKKLDHTSQDCDVIITVAAATPTPSSPANVTKTGNSPTPAGQPLDVAALSATTSAAASNSSSPS
jgi:hypothetical protein